MKDIKNVFFTLGVFALIIVGLILMTQAAGTPPASSQVNSSVLKAEETAFDFGTISMSKGTVSHGFSVLNGDSQAVELTKLYTSCMCTQAVLKIADQTFGPFGMPGHGVVPAVNQTLPAGDKAAIEVIFDPAAHGPSGVGKISRSVSLETSKGKVVFTFTANVTP